MTGQKTEIKPLQNTSSFTYKLIDAISIVLGIWFLIWWVPDLNSRSTLLIALLAVGIFGMIAEFVGLYRNWHGVAIEREIACSIIAWAMTLIGLAGLGKFSLYSSEISARGLLTWFAITPVISFNARMLIRFITRLRSRSGHARGFVVVGATDLGIQLVRNIEKRPDLGLRFNGFYDDRPADRGAELPGDLDKRLGNLDELVGKAIHGEIQTIFIALPMRAEERMKEVVERLADTTASVYIVPDFFVFQLLHSRWTDIQGMPVVSVYENPFYGADGALKRFFDIAASSALIAATAIPMAIIALVVKLTSKGPVLFKQRRYGLDGKEIMVWKFRSMTVCEDGAKVTQATKNDKRVTPVGAFLRKSSLDELPQLFNVFTGQMSLVGPRPHASAHNEYYRKEIEGYMLRHKVKPGITGLAQVNGCRGETEQIEKMEKRIFFDHKYIREWNIWMDLKILFQTIKVVFSRQNAY
jgi:putative colanic acid biosynthesis UDP-glucose lipid carrier transferase